MRIALDVSPLDCEYLTGVERGLLQVLDGLQKHGTGHEFFLVAPKRPRHLPTALGKAFAFFPLVARGTSSFWRQRLAPRFCAIHNIQLWHSFVRAIPLRLAIPEIATVHELSEDAAPNTRDEGALWKRRWLTQAILKRASAIVCVSPETAHQVLQRAPKAKNNLAVLGHGVSSQFHANAKVSEEAKVRDFLNLPDSAPWLLFLGRPLLRKGRPRAVRAFAEAQKSLPQLHLVLAGPPAPQDDGALEIAAQCGLQNQVRQIGFLPEDLLPAVLRQAGALLMPSFSEGFGLPVLEAMACGTPVLSSGAGGLASTAGSAALTVDFDQAQVAGDACLNAIANRAAIADLGLSHVLSFSVDHTSRALLALWEKVLLAA